MELSDRQIKELRYFAEKHDQAGQDMKINPAVILELTKDKPKRGGRRNPPGGRPPLPPEERKIKINITLSPATVERIKAQRKRPNEPLSQVIERLLTNDERNDE